MNSFKEYFKDWFGYSRRERRSTFILLNIILVVVGLRYFFPARDISLREIDFDLPESRIDSSQMTQDTRVVKKQVRPGTSVQRRPPLDLNSCDSASLEALPGIGPVLSSRIIKYRNLIGGYVSVDQLKEVYGLSEETFNLISSVVLADSASIRKLKINESDYRQLIRHPYLQKSEVNAILKYRELNGRISGIACMTDNNLVSAETAKKIRPYLEFGD